MTQNFEHLFEIKCLPAGFSFSDAFINLLETIKNGHKYVVLQEYFWYPQNFKGFQDASEFLYIPLIN